MKNSNNPIVATIQRRQEVSQKRRELKIEAQKLKQEQAAVNQEFIANELKKFIKSVERNPNPYIFGDSHTFTKFVNRSGMYLNSKHNSAIHEFNLAKENLARVFVVSILKNDNDERQKIITQAGIKNVKDMEFYFQG